MSCTYPDLDDWHGLIPAEVDPDAVVRCEALAWTTMLGLTAGRVAVCPITVRPAVAVATATTSTTVVTADPAVLVLERPVGTIVEVRLSGAMLSPLAYRREDNTLRRLDGQPWPATTDMTLPLGSGEIEVTYYQGRRPGLSFMWAVATLAAEFYLATSDVKGKKCRLPDNVTAVTRQGVTYEINPGIFSDGLTGIREIDAVIRQYNPNHLSQPTLVMSPDSITAAPTRFS